MLQQNIARLIVLAIATRTGLALPVQAADWSQWGGTSARNMVSSERGLADSFGPGKKDPQGGGIRPETTQNVLWTAKLGSMACSTPAVCEGRVFIGACEDGQGVLKCLDAQTGSLLWRWAAPARDVPKRMGDRIFRFSQFPHTLGVCSSPTVDGDRVYIVSHRCEVLCFDVQGANEPGEPKILWTFDMWDFGVRPSDACNCSVLVHGDFIYVCTSNGVDRDATAQTHDEFRPIPAPDAPMLIVLEKRTGRLVASDDANTGPRLLHGQWSSPSLGQVGGRTLVFLGGGDGVCYAFEALQSIRTSWLSGQASSAWSSLRVQGSGFRVQDTDWCLYLNPEPRTLNALVAAEGPTVPTSPQKLKTAWWCDCNPSEYKQFGQLDRVTHYCRGDHRRSDTINESDGTFAGMSEIIATPVFDRGRVYVAIGRDPEHGRGRGALWCIDASKTGDITTSGKIWCYQGLDRTMSTVSVSDGLVYIADVAGRLHCLDADTGAVHWIHETGAKIWGSTLVADGKVYLPTEKHLWVLVHGRQKQVLSQISLGAPVWATPVAANGVLYVASKNYLWAVKSRQ